VCLSDLTNATAPIYQQIDPADVRVTCKDQVSGYTVSPTAFTLAPNATKSFSVNLKSLPTSNVVLTFASTNIGEVKFNIAGTVTNTVSLTFTPANFDTPQTVTAAATADTGNGDVIVQLTSTVSTSDGTYAGAQTPVVTVTKSNAGTGGGSGGGGTTVGPTTFAANTRYAVSFPLFYTNKTTTLDNVFNLKQNASGFKLFKFNKLAQVGTLLPAGNPNTTPQPGQAPTTEYVEVLPTEALQRGVGYLLITGTVPVTFKTTANDPLLLPYSGTTFTTLLYKNISASAPADGSKNGLNFIGFPFDITKYTQSSFENAQILANGVTYNSLLEAVAAGVMSPNLYTTDANGKLVQITASNRYIKANNGYFVQVYVNNMTITLRQPS